MHTAGYTQYIWQGMVTPSTIPIFNTILASFHSCQKVYVRLIGFLKGKSTICGNWVLSLFFFFLAVFWAILRFRTFLSAQNCTLCFTSITGSSETVLWFLPHVAVAGPHGFTVTGIPQANSHLNDHTKYKGGFSWKDKCT